MSRWALLDAFSSVARDGTFSSKIARPRDRFLRVADQVRTSMGKFAGCTQEGLCNSFVQTLPLMRIFLWRTWDAFSDTVYAWRVAR